MYLLTTLQSDNDEVIPVLYSFERGNNNDAQKIIGTFSKNFFLIIGL